MVSLFKKLQVQNACYYGSQQLLLLYRYKEYELQASLLGPKIFLIPFLSWQLLGQGKCDCGWFITVFVKNLNMENRV